MIIIGILTFGTVMWYGITIEREFRFPNMPDNILTVHTDIVRYEYGYGLLLFFAYSSMISALAFTWAFVYRLSTLFALLCLSNIPARSNTKTRWSRESTRRKTTCQVLLFQRLNTPLRLTTRENLTKMISNLELKLRQVSF